MKVVLDTNVLVSGMLTPYGTCGEIVRMITSGDLKLCVDARIIIEYDEILHRPHFDINPHLVDVVMEYIQGYAQICSTIPLRESLPDPDDEVFLEVALTGLAECLVTGNLKHFPKHARAGVPVFSSAQFIDYYKKHSVA